MYVFVCVALERKSPLNESEGRIHGQCDIKALSCHRRDEAVAKGCRCRPFSG